MLKGGPGCANKGANRGHCQVLAQRRQSYLLVWFCGICCGLELGALADLALTTLASNGLLQLLAVLAVNLCRQLLGGNLGRSLLSLSRHHLRKKERSCLCFGRVGALLRLEKRLNAVRFVMRMSLARATPF